MNVTFVNSQVIIGMENTDCMRVVGMEVSRQASIMVLVVIGGIMLMIDMPIIIVTDERTMNMRTVITLMATSLKRLFIVINIMDTVTARLAAVSLMIMDVIVSGTETLHSTVADVKDITVVINTTAQFLLCARCINQSINTHLYSAMCRERNNIQHHSLDTCYTQLYSDSVLGCVNYTNGLQ